MPLHGTCKCGKDPVTNAAEGLDWHLNGCSDCGEDVTFKVERSGDKPTRPGKGK